MCASTLVQCSPHAPPPCPLLCVGLVAWGHRVAHCVHDVVAQRHARWSSDGGEKQEAPAGVVELPWANLSQGPSKIKMSRKIFSLFNFVHESAKILF